MPTIWKVTFQEPDTSGLMDRLFGELESQKTQQIETWLPAAPSHPATSQNDPLAA